MERADASSKEAGAMMLKIIFSLVYFFCLIGKAFQDLQPYMCFMVNPYTKMGHIKIVFALANRQIGIVPIGSITH